MKNHLMMIVLVVAALGCGEDEGSKWSTEESVSCVGDSGTCGCQNEIDEVCVDGEWVCPVDVNCDSPQPCDDPAPDCASICGVGTAVCGADGWECEFDSTGCNSTNNNNLPGDCDVQSRSSLDGVTIVFSDEVCTWTLDDVAAGVTIAYAVEISEEVVVSPQSYVSCPSLGDAGLAQFESISGGDQQYCLCDEGLCPNDLGESTLAPGTYLFEIAWDGRNWQGPSDTGNPKGDAFPAGEYTAKVVASGTVVATGEVYEVASELAFRLIE